MIISIVDIKSQKDEVIGTILFFTIFILYILFLIITYICDNFLFATKSNKSQQKCLLSVAERCKKFREKQFREKQKIVSESIKPNEDL